MLRAGLQPYECCCHQNIFVQLRYQNREEMESLGLTRQSRIDICVRERIVGGNSLEKIREERSFRNSHPNRQSSQKRRPPLNQQPLIQIRRRKHQLRQLQQPHGSYLQRLNLQNHQYQIHCFLLRITHEKQILGDH